MGFGTQSMLLKVSTWVGVDVGPSQGTAVDRCSSASSEKPKVMSIVGTGKGILALDSNSG